MKENIAKGVITAAITSVGLYFKGLAVPLVILGIVMLMDYITGIAGAWMLRQLCSRIGVVGIIKKLAYLCAVAVAIVVDYVIQHAAGQAGLDLSGFYMFGLLVTIWLILNECISIIENISEMGVPLPAFLVAIVEKLKKTTEAQGDAEVGTEAQHGNDKGN